MNKKWLLTSLGILLILAAVVAGFSRVSAGMAAADGAEKIEGALLDRFAAEGTSDFIVRFVEQADLSAAYSMDWDARGQFVVDALTAAADRSQVNAIAILDAQSVRHQTFIAGNDLYVYAGTLELANSLAALPEVYFIRAPRTYYIDPISEVNPLENVKWAGDMLAYGLAATPGAISPDTPEWGITDSGATQFWTTFNVRGEGIKVANIDTGVRWTHQALTGKYGCPGGNHADCWLDPDGVFTSPQDGNGHGTHTMGTMIGSFGANEIGVAPNATWLACQGCDTNSCDDVDLLSCGSWILQPNGNPANRPNIVNNSWGGTPDGDTWYLATVNSWRAAGIFPAFSAGNSGPTCDSMGDPGSYQESFASAAHQSGRAIAGFSSRGPSAFGHDPYTKPNISAPGVNVRSSYNTSDSAYVAIDGTSMASPHTAGAVALLWSCNPALVGQIDQTFQLMQNTADTPPAGNCGAPPDGQGNYTFGYGYLNVMAAGLQTCAGVAAGTLQGHVFDTGGLPIQGATVQAVPALASQIDAITDPTGFYSMTLATGFYNVTASKVGYGSVTFTNLEILTDTTTTQDFTLPFQGQWTPGPDSPFDWYRFDCTYFDDGTGPSAYNQKVYCMGGRDTGTTEVPDIWTFDPVAGTYADSTFNVFEDVSNYDAIVLNDENFGTRGPAIYMVGGTDRDGSGGMTNLVQRYYPQTHQSESVGSDPWPGTLGGTVVTPGACVSTPDHSKIYCFGGWSNTTGAPPYNVSYTYEYDPARPAGTRWMQMAGSNLSVARGYIQSAVQGNFIYAMGGDTYDGADLAPTTVVERLDIGNPNGGWTLLAPLPVASGEGRGFGFTTDTMLDQVWMGKLYVAGGGDWSSNTIEVMEYDIATNTWDQTFPDLIEPRRNGGGFFVPLCTPDPTDGLPGMWVIGGWLAADNPPFAQPEYFPFEDSCGAATVAKTAPATAFHGDVIPYHITLTFPDGLLGSAVLTDVIPTGVEFFGNLSASFGTATYDAGTNAVYWTGSFLGQAVNLPPSTNAGESADVVGESAPDAVNVPAATVPDVPFTPEAILWDNGPLVTHPGGGFGGADASVLQTALGMGTYGYGHQQALGLHVADDFTITDAGGWDVSQVTFFGYQTGAPTSPSTFTGMYFQIWNGPPNDPGSTVVFGDLTTNRLVNSTWSNIYRAIDTNPVASNRPVMANTASGGFHLDPGTYWIDFSATGSLASGPWVPPVTILGQTTTGNAMQFNAGAWTNLIDVGPQGLPFIIEGTGGGGGPAEVTIDFDVTVTSVGGTITNLAVMDYNGAMSSGSAQTTVLVPDVTFTKTAPATAWTGDVIPYTLDVNLGAPFFGTGVITDALPAGVTFAGNLTATFGTATYDAGTNSVYWSSGPVVGGSSTPSTGTGTRQVELSFDSIPTTGPSPEAPTPDAPVALVLDDGSANNSIGIGGTWEFIFLNRFTPAAGEFPFDLNQVQIFWPTNGNVQVGDNFIITVFENTSGNVDPAIGANYLASFPITANTIGAWEVYNLGTAVHLNGPGDVLIGVIALEKPGSSYWPATIDTTASQQRSWAGWWLSTPPPTPPTLPPDDAWGMIDSFGFAGNWMVRGYGETAPNPTTFSISFDVTVSAQSGTITNSADFDYNGYPFTASDSTVVNVASITLAKTVGTVPSTCATTDTVNVPVGTTVYYCYTVTNTGNVAMPLHDLVDDQLGALLTDFPYTLNPGGSVFFIQSAVVTQNVTNTGTWTAHDNAGHQASASDTATVTVFEPIQDIFLPIILKSAP